MSFNIGDKVRATQYPHWGSVPAGTTGVVAESAGSGDARVDFGSHATWWYDVEDLELVEADPKYRAGDKVRFTETRGGYANTEETGVIVSFEPATSTTSAGYMVECRRPGNDGWVNLFFFENEIAGLVEEITEEQFVDRDLRNNPWQDYVEHNGYHGRDAQLHFHIDRRLGSEESQTRAKELLAELYPEDTRSSTQPDTRSEMNRKMDTVREAGERRRQKLITHTHKLEAVIRDRNAEIETLRAALSKVAQVASDEVYKNIPMHTYPF